MTTTTGPPRHTEHKEPTMARQPLDAQLNIRLTKAERAAFKRKADQRGEVAAEQVRLMVIAYTKLPARRTSSTPAHIKAVVDVAAKDQED